VALPDLEGNERTLAEFQGRPTLLLFWNPTCGFCARMLDDLRAWEAAATDAHPQIVAISRGSVESNVELGLRAPVLIDDEFATGRLFGSGGTPSAVLIDADGNIASSVTIGAAAVFALANGADAAIPSRSEP
jgi:peroxiredoxin